MVISYFALGCLKPSPSKWWLKDTFLLVFHYWCICKLTARKLHWRFNYFNQLPDVPHRHARFEIKLSAEIWIAELNYRRAKPVPSPRMKLHCVPPLPPPSWGTASPTMRWGKVSWSKLHPWQFSRGPRGKNILGALYPESATVAPL